MPDVLDTLILDLLEWIGPDPKLNAEVMAVWRTSCPRLPVWEEAHSRGYVVRRSEPSGATLRVTEVGQAFLRKHRNPPAAERI